MFTCQDFSFLWHNFYLKSVFCFVFINNQSIFFALDSKLRKVAATALKDLPITCKSLVYPSISPDLEYLSIYCPRRRWKDNIRMYLEEMGINAGNWVDSAQDRNYWRALVNAALKLRVP